MESSKDCVDKWNELSPTGSPEAFVWSFLPYPKHDIFVSEFLISHPGIDIADFHVWININDLVSKYWEFDFGAQEWQIRWLDHLDQEIVKEHHLHVNIELPIIEKTDSLRTQLEKASVRLTEYQRQYAKLCLPLPLSFLTCNNEDVSLKEALCKCRGKSFGKCDPLSLKYVKATMTGDGDVVCPPFNPNEFGIKENLFNGMLFYLPHSSDILKEVDRWKVVMLIWLHGGACSLRESDIVTKKAIVFATGDERKNLWKIARWYDCKIYKPSVIEECVKEGKRLDAEMLAQNEWYSECRR